MTASETSATIVSMADAGDALERLKALRQHQQAGKRSPHKPLLVLLALGELASTGSSALHWSQVEQRLARLIADFGPPTRTGAAQSAADPFTRLRSDGVWTLSAKSARAAMPLGRRRFSQRGIDSARSADTTASWEAARLALKPPTSAGSTLAARTRWTTGSRSAPSTTSCSIVGSSA